MRKIAIALLAAVLIAAFTVPVSAAYRDMWAQVYSWTGSKADGEMIIAEITTGVTFVVLQRNSDTEETLTEYGDNTYTSLTNPVNTTNYADATVMKEAGVLSFRVDPGESGDRYVDLIVTNTAGGYSEFVEDFDIYQHSIILDQRPGVVHKGTIFYSMQSPTASVPNEGWIASGSEVDTGVTLASDTTVIGMVLEVVDVSSANGLSVGVDSTGTAGDADGWLDQIVLTTAGYIANSLASTGTFLDDATNYRMGGHTITGSNEGTITYTVDSVTTAGTHSGGYIHYWFMRAR